MKPPKGRRGSTGQLPQLSLGLSLVAATATAPCQPDEPTKSPQDTGDDTFPPLESIKDQIRLMFQGVHNSAGASSPKTRPKSASSGSGRRSSVAGPVSQVPRELAMRRGSESATISSASFLNTSFDDQALEAIRIPNPAFYMRESHYLERQVSYEEELERKTWTLREVALSWKHRWQRERTERKLLAQKVAECEQECVRVIENLKDQHDARVQFLEGEMSKMGRMCEDVTREKSTLEASFRKVIKQVQLESKRKKITFQESLTALKQKNESLQQALTNIEQEKKKLQAENEKLELQLNELSQQTRKDSGNGDAPDKFGDYYKMLLDIAINKVRHVEDTSCKGTSTRTSPLPGGSRRNSNDSALQTSTNATLAMWRMGTPEALSWDSMSSLESLRSDPNDKQPGNVKKPPIPIPESVERGLSKQMSLESWPELPEGNVHHDRHVSDPVVMTFNSSPDVSAGRTRARVSDSAESGYQSLDKQISTTSSLSHSHSEDNLIAVAVESDDPSSDDRTKYNTIGSNRHREKRSVSVGTIRDKANPSRRSRSCQSQQLENDVLSLSENNLLEIDGDDPGKPKKVSKTNLLAKWQGDIKRTWKMKRKKNLTDLGVVFKGKHREKDCSSSGEGDAGSAPEAGGPDPGPGPGAPDEESQAERGSPKSGFKPLTSRRNGVAMQMADQLQVSEGLKKNRGKGNILDLLKTWKPAPHNPNTSTNNNVYKKPKEQRKNFGKV